MDCRRAKAGLRGGSGPIRRCSAHLDDGAIRAPCAAVRAYFADDGDLREDLRSVQGEQWVALAAFCARPSPPPAEHSVRSRARRTATYRPDATRARRQRPQTRQQTPLHPAKAADPAAGQTSRTQGPPERRAAPRLQLDLWRRPESRRPPPAGARRPRPSPPHPSRAHLPHGPPCSAAAGAGGWRREPLALVPSPFRRRCRRGPGRRSRRWRT
jgi:hypothetical protein